jgi:hypothetical protein
VSLTFDALGTPWVGYVDGTFGSLRTLSSVGQSVPTWQLVTGAEQFSSGSSELDVAVAPDGAPWVVWKGAYSGDGVYARRLVLNP